MVEEEGVTICHLASLLVLLDIGRWYLDISLPAKPLAVADGAKWRNVVEEA